MKFGMAGFLTGWLLGGVLVYFAVQFLTGQAGNAAASVYLSSGSSTPALREYSLGDALAAQGRFEEALQEFQRCAALYPDDPEPCLRQARLLRDRLQQPHESVQAF